MVARGQTLSGSHGLSGPARRHARRGSRKSGSHATRRWRDRDSNYWSPGRERVIPFGDVKQGMVTYTTEGGAETVSTSSGTEGSNPAPSSSESGANLKLGLERSLGTRLVTYADDLVILCRSGSNPWSYSLPWLADLVRSRFANKGLRRPIHPYGRALPQRRCASVELASFGLEPGFRQGL